MFKHHLILSFTNKYYCIYYLYKTRNKPDFLHGEFMTATMIREPYSSTWSYISSEALEWCFA